MVESVSETEGPIATDGGGRSCGGCAACCEGWLTDKKMNLFPGSACSHIVPEGCGIYETRPESPCRAFHCAWLQEPQDFPDEMRPDKSGVILRKDRNWNAWRVIRAFPCGSKVPQEALSWLIDYAKPQQLPIIFYEHQYQDGNYSGMEAKALGPPKFTEAVKRQPDRGDIFYAGRALDSGQ